MSALREEQREPLHADVTPQIIVALALEADRARMGLLVKTLGAEAVAVADPSSIARAIGEGDVLVVADEILANDREGLVVGALRRRPAWSSLPVLLLSHTDDLALLHRRGLSPLGGVVLIGRPVRLAALTTILRSALETRRQQRAAQDARVARDASASALGEQQQRLRFALTAGGLGAWELEVETGAVECSDTARRILGKASAEPLRWSDVLSVVHPEDRARLEVAAERALAGETDFDVEYRVRLPSGAERGVLSRGRVLPTPGAGRRIAGVMLDITDRLQMVEALETSRRVLADQAASLERADRRKDEFLATLAHELRNPLAPLRTGLELLSTESESDQGARALGIMSRHLEHMVHLVDDLLDISRVTQGKLELRPTTFQLAELLADAADTSADYVKRGHHRLSTAIEAPHTLVRADRTRLAQVVANLLNNAAKYTPPGGAIELSAHVADADLTIEVRDDGIGLAPERLDDVFEIFSQVKPKDQASQGGLGLGLALVREIVRLHGGTVEVSSEGLGKGSCFRVRVPCALPPGTHPAEPARPADSLFPRPVPIRQTPASGARVLVVDDNEDAADLLAHLLSREGYETRAAYDGTSAIEAVRAFEPRFVVLDVGLPDMSGYDVARAVRRDVGQAVRLIALTGWGTTEDRRKAREAGFDAHLTKPATIDALREALQAG